MSSLDSNKSYLTVRCRNWSHEAHQILRKHILHFLSLTTWIFITTFLHYLTWKHYFLFSSHSPLDLAESIIWPTLNNKKLNWFKNGYSDLLVIVLIENMRFLDKVMVMFVDVPWMCKQKLALVCIDRTQHIKEQLYKCANEYFQTASTSLYFLKFFWLYNILSSSFSQMPSLLPISRGGYWWGKKKTSVVPFSCSNMKWIKSTEILSVCWPKEPNKSFMITSTFNSYSGNILRGGYHEWHEILALP